MSENTPKPNRALTRKDNASMAVARTDALIAASHKIITESKAHQSMEKELAEYKTFFENISPLLDKLDKSPELVQAIVDGEVYRESTLATFAVTVSEKKDNLSKLYAVRVVDLLIKHPDFCIELLSHFYIFNAGLLEEFLSIWHEETESCYHIYDILSHVQCVRWTEELIENNSTWLHADKESWSGGLSHNDSIPWTAELIEKYKEKLLERDRRWVNDCDERTDWEKERDEEQRKEEYESFCDAEGHYDGPDEPTDPDELDDTGFEPTTTGFETLSSNRGVFWSVELLERFKDHWNWHALSSNESIPWSDELIARFHDRWDWKLLDETLTRIFDQDHTVNIYEDWRVPYGLNWEIYRNENDVSKLLDLLEAEANLLEVHSQFLANATIWQKVFSPVLNDDLVAWIIRRLSESDKVRVDEENAAYNAAHPPEPSISASAPQDKNKNTEDVDQEIRLEDIPF
jgi:hypothetical protein